MQEWKLKEQALQKQENAWYENLSPFMKVIDDHRGFFLVMGIVSLLAFGLGLGIGFLL